MKRVFYDTVLTLCLSLTLIGVAHGAEHITFDGSPMTISVHSEIERQIVFPDNSSIVIGVNADQLGDFKTLSSIDNRVFIQGGKEKVKRQKLIFKDQNSGTNFIVYVQSSTDSDLDPLVNIHLPKNKGKTSALSSEKNNRINSYPFLTRYVFQQLYSPDRLIKDHPLIRRVSVDPKSINNLFGCFSGSMACTALSAKPIVSYRTDKLYVSAIELSNISNNAVDVDARMILRSPRDLLTASFMHHRLLPSNTGSKSKTVLVLIHKRPLREFFYEQGVGR